MSNFAIINILAFSRSSSIYGAWGLGRRDADMNQTRPLPWRSSWACEHTTTKLDDESKHEKGIAFGKPRAAGSVCGTREHSRLV